MTREEKRQYQREYAKKNPDKIKKWRISHIARNPDYKEQRNRQARERYKDPKYQEIKRNYKLKNRYGITLEEFKIIFDKQGGVCALCGKPEEVKNILSVDHNHKTGKIRGLLCHKCNVGIGHFKENLELLKKIIEYLKKHK